MYGTRNTYVPTRMYPCVYPVCAHTTLPSSVPADECSATSARCLLRCPAELLLLICHCGCVAPGGALALTKKGTGCGTHGGGTASYERPRETAAAAAGCCGGRALLCSCCFACGGRTRLLKKKKASVARGADEVSL